MPRQVSIKELKKKMGEDTVNKLYEEFAGMTIYIPKKGIEYTQEEKEEYILNLFYSGRPLPSIANEMNLSIDRIRKIIYENYNKTS